ncbi:MAG: sensor histidine kinase [Deltaproteobacteria bacterium]|nr:sensor histidine kinase [Deltaproteobacteria bacterium]
MTGNLKARIQNFERRQIIVSLVGLVALLFLSVVFNFIHLSRQAEQTAKFISRMIQIEDFREVGITLQEAKLDHFSVIKYISSDTRRSFTLPEISELMPDNSFWRKLTHDTVTVDVTSASSSRDKVTFEFSRFKETGWAFFIWLVLNLVSIPQTRLMKKRIVQDFDESVKIETELARAEVARKLRHNIRTPLSALIRLSSRSGSLDANKALLNNVIDHIKNLVSELDEPNTASTPDSLFHPVLTNAMREIRLVSPSRLTVTTEVDDSLISAHGNFVGHELRSILTNLVTNAFEATADGGRVDVIAHDFGDRVIIEVKDNGKGIPSSILPRVTENGFSFDKTSGTGLGLHHATKNVEDWGGELRISSDSGIGTLVRVSIPIGAREPWYVPRIKLHSGDTVVVVDDQLSVHDVWKERLLDAGFAGAAKFFSNAESALVFLGKSVGTESKKVVFADYDLGTEQTGFDVLSKLPDGSVGFLVTGHFDDLDVQARCRSLAVHLMPKTSLSDIPLVVR